LRRSLRDVVKALRHGRSAIGLSDTGLSDTGLTDNGLAGGARPRAKAPPLPEGAQFLTRSFTCAAGTRRYRLYVPASAPEGLNGLIVMLHGCKQSPEDFATGTKMNSIAEANRLLVAYPAQSGADNAASCWNWFRPADQRRDAGEPAILAGLTRHIAAEFDIRPGRIFAAGLSAGGAMAAVLGATYPDLFAAIGVHSGLPVGAANDVVSAFAAMRGDGGPAAAPPRGSGSAGGPPTIVFHGSADRTVHPSNADRLVAAAKARTASATSHSRRGGAGRPYTRTLIEAADGAAAAELWMIDGAGHAWAGGHAAGSYTDPRGPDASAEMVRFFLSQ
jgi:poly(hydroxyalkanoate) depolymerase family esterase